MKEHRKQIIFAFLCIMLILLVIYKYPKRFYQEYSGIMYRLGDGEYQETVEITIDGYLSNGFFKGNLYEGTMLIGKKKLSKLDMEFDAFGRGILFYFDEELGEYTSFGDIYTKNMNKEITITVLEDRNSNTTDKSWTSKDGLIISAPAENRDEAIEITKDLMKDVLSIEK